MFWWQHLIEVKGSSLWVSFHNVLDNVCTAVVRQTSTHSVLVSTRLLYSKWWSKQTSSYIFLIQQIDRFRSSSELESINTFAAHIKMVLRRHQRMDAGLSAILCLFRICSVPFSENVWCENVGHEQFELLQPYDCYVHETFGDRFRHCLRNWCEKVCFNRKCLWIALTSRCNVLRRSFIVASKCSLQDHQRDMCWRWYCWVMSVSFSSITSIFNIMALCSAFYCWASAKCATKSFYNRRFYSQFCCIWSTFSSTCLPSTLFIYWNFIAYERAHRC